jgi:polygalacturonase
MTNDTAALQKILDRAGDVLIPKGTYLIDADKGLHLRSGTNLAFSPGAVFKALPSAMEKYSILKASDVSDVKITGPGILQGERKEHDGTTGQWGMGLRIDGGSRNIRVVDLTTRDCWGDGFYISGAANVSLSRVTADGNRRQGLSIIEVDGLTVRQSIFKNTKGTKPGAGIDLEPNKVTPKQVIQNVLIENSQFLHNAKAGILIHGKNGIIRNVIVRNNVYEGNMPIHVCGVPEESTHAPGIWAYLIGKLFQTYSGYPTAALIA